MSEVPNTQVKYVAVDEGGQVASKRYHWFLNCSTLKNSEAGMEEVGEKLATLLGLRACSVCEKRLTGGPAIEALTDILKNAPNDDLAEEGSEATAWYIVEELKARGFYVARKRSST